MPKSHLRARQQAFDTFTLLLEPGGLTLEAPTASQYTSAKDDEYEEDTFYTLEWPLAAPPSAALLEAFERALFRLDRLMARWPKLRTALHKSAIQVAYHPEGEEASLKLLETEELNIVRRLLGFTSLHALAPTLPVGELLSHSRVPLPPIPTAITRNKDLEARASYTEDLAFYFLLGVSRGDFLFDWSLEGDEAYTLEQFRFTRNLLQFIARDGAQNFKEFLEASPADVAFNPDLLDLRSHSSRSHKLLFQEPKLLALKAQEVRFLMNSLFYCHDELVPWLMERLLAVRKSSGSLKLDKNKSSHREYQSRPALLKASSHFLTSEEESELETSMGKHRLHERIESINPGLYALFSFAWLTSSPSRFEEFVFYMLQHWGRAHREGRTVINAAPHYRRKSETLALMDALTDVADAPLTHIMLFSRAKFEEVSHGALS